MLPLVYAAVELSARRAVEVYASDSSMEPTVRAGARVRLEPISDLQGLRRGEIVLARVKGRLVLHLISALEGSRVQISNNHGQAHGWIARPSVLGRAIEIDNSLGGAASGWEDFPPSART